MTGLRRNALLILVAAGILASGLLFAQRRQMEGEKIGDGMLYTVLPPDRIPAINNPVFVSAKEGDKFMAPDEPVLGLFDGKVAKAYSLWHLDRHEIVNDSLPGMGPVAVTW